MRTAVYPGSFDPMTLGHLDVIRRSSPLFETLVVAIARNINKTGLFDYPERVAHIEEAVAGLDNVKVDMFDGLLVEYMRRSNIRAVVRGLRAFTDFENEFQMALMNKHMNPDMETVFLVTNAEYSYISSSAVKEIASFGGCVDGLVTDNVKKALREKLGR